MIFPGNSYFFILILQSHGHQPRVSVLPRGISLIWRPSTRARSFSRSMRWWSLPGRTRAGSTRPYGRRTNRAGDHFWGCGFGVFWCFLFFLVEKGGDSLWQPCKKAEFLQKHDEFSIKFLSGIIWLVVWNMTFIFPYIGNVIIPIDLHIFQRGRLNQQFWLWCTTDDVFLVDREVLQGCQLSFFPHGD